MIACSVAAMRPPTPILSGQQWIAPGAPTDRSNRLTTGCREREQSRCGAKGRSVGPRSTELLQPGPLQLFGLQHDPQRHVRVDSG